MKKQADSGGIENKYGEDGPIWNFDNAVRAFEVYNFCVVFVFVFLSWYVYNLGYNLGAAWAFNKAREVTSRNDRSDYEIPDVTHSVIDERAEYGITLIYIVDEEE